MTLRERLAASVADIRSRGQRLVQLNRELLAAELKEKGKKFGAAIGMFVGAGLLSLYAIGFALATVAVALALVLPLWLSLLIVTLALFLVVAILVLVGRDQLRKIGTPEPEIAIAEAKATADLMKTSARETATRVRERAAPSPAKRGPEVLAPPTTTPRPGPDAPASGPPSDEGARES
jgi:Putative Actinobacterial Holin-X, holin superfamily III